MVDRHRAEKPWAGRWGCFVSRGTTKRQPPAGAAPQPWPLGYDPTGKVEPVDILSSKDGWSEYNLDDGTVLRVKAVALDVKKAIGQYSPDGDPIYLVQSALVTQVKVPDGLKKK
jgi:hypothetical protein